MEKGMVLALGFFDGVHCGHMQLIRKTIEIAEEKHLIPGVLTFENHPLTVIFPEKAPLLLTDNEEKIALLDEAGIEKIILTPFTTELMQLSPEDFIHCFLLKNYPVRHIVVGYDYSFGYKGKGNVEDLKAIGKNSQFGVSVIPPYQIDHQKVCSTMIRNRILNGNVADIPECLGRYYSVSGHVIHGKALGRKFGIPTANICVSNQKVLPDNGVYYSKITYNNKTYDGLTNIGYNPTFENHPFSVETYIYDFDEDIYDEKVTVTFISKQRDEIKFSSLDELIRQIRKDIHTIDEFRKNMPEVAP